MASTVKRAVERLFRPKHDYLPGDTVFREIDVEAIARDLKVEEYGERDGRAGTPRSNSKTLTATENEITKRIESYWASAGDAARRAHEGYVGRLGSLGGQTELDLVEGRPSDVAAHLRESAHSHAQSLNILNRDYLAAEEDLSRFKVRECIERPAKEPKSWGARAFLLAFAAVAELAINAGVFTEGDEFGLAGALLKVIGIPPLNILVAFALVFIMGRHLWRPHFASKILGLAGFALASAWVFTLNLTVAHWRDALGGALASDAGRLVVDRITTAPFDLNSIESWMLFSIGCMAGLMGMVDAVIWHDPHPGYTTRTVARNIARDEFLDAREDAVEEIGKLSDDALASLTQAQRAAELGAARRPEIGQRIEALNEDLDRYRLSLQAAADTLIARYRETNARVRSTEPPARFDEPIRLNLSTIKLPQYRASGGRGVSGRLRKAITEIASARTDALSLLPSLSTKAHEDGA